MGMQRIRKVSRGGWLAIGILLALVLAPSAAIATAAGVTEITGPGGQRAAVTDAGQLTVTQTTAGSYEVRGGSEDTTTTTPACLSFPAISATTGFVIKEITVSVYSDPSPGTSELGLDEGPNCNVAQVITTLTPASVGMTVLPIDPGLAIPAGGTFSFAVQDMGAFVTLYGYKVPSSEVSGYTPNH
jgi:hypothetical protein